MEKFCSDFFLAQEKIGSDFWYSPKSLRTPANRLVLQDEKQIQKKMDFFRARRAIFKILLFLQF